MMSKVMMLGLCVLWLGTPGIAETLTAVGSDALHRAQQAMAVEPKPEVAAEAEGERPAEAGESVSMKVQTVSDTDLPTVGAKRNSRVLWYVNDIFAGGDSAFNDQSQDVAIESFFKEMPMTIQPSEVFTPFSFLSLDLGILPPVGQGYIDYLRPVQRQTEPEEVDDNHVALRKQ